MFAYYSILHEMAVLVDVLNNVLDDHHERHCQEHACCIKELAPQDDAQDDGNRVQVQGLAHDGRVDQVVVYLRHNQVKACRLDGQPRGMDSCHENTEAGCHRRAQHRDKLAESRCHGKDGGIRQIHDAEISVDDKAGDEADDKLAADVGAQ